MNDPHPFDCTNTSGWNTSNLSTLFFLFDVRPDDIQYNLLIQVTYVRIYKLSPSCSHLASVSSSGSAPRKQRSVACVRTPFDFNVLLNSPFNALLCQAHSSEFSLGMQATYRVLKRLFPFSTEHKRTLFLSTLYIMHFHLAFSPGVGAEQLAWAMMLPSTSHIGHVHGVSP